MAYLIWSDFFSVGVPALDQQHKVLFKIINDFYASVKNGKNKDKIFQTLHELIIYCEKHFKDEERLLKKVNYPGKEFSLHSKFHDKLLSDIFSITEMLEKNDENLIYKLETFLNGWLIKHILFNDKKYEPYFRMNLK